MTEQTHNFDKQKQAKALLVKYTTNTTMDDLQTSSQQPSGACDDAAVAMSEHPVKEKEQASDLPPRPSSSEMSISEAAETLAEASAPTAPTESAPSSSTKQYTSSSDRHYILALWEPTKNPFVAKLEPKLEEVARKAEEEADEAICLEMEEDGTLTVHSSKHSVPKSLLAMGIKLAIVWPLGLAGAIGIAKAGIEIEAATRTREREGVTDDELSLLMKKMKPGWCAFIAVYKEWMIPAAVSACAQLGAVAIWDGKGGDIEELIEETHLDKAELVRQEGNIRVMDSLGGTGQSVHKKNSGGPKVQKGTSMDSPEDKANACCSGYLARLGNSVCCCCTCVVTQIANVFL